MKKSTKDSQYGGDLMYIILMYDIVSDKGGAKVQRNVFKICKRYLTHIQKSVFEGELSPVQLLRMQKELEDYIRKDRDSVLIFKSRNERWLEKEFWGLPDEKCSQFF